MTQMMNCSCILFASWRDSFMNYYWSNSHSFSSSCNYVPRVLIHVYTREHMRVQVHEPVSSRNENGLHLPHNLTTGAKGLSAPKISI